MIDETFKPIPKYILKEIKSLDLKHYPNQTGFTRFYSYLTKFKKQLIRVIVAVKNHKNKWYCKQVVLHGIHSDKCYVKDIIFYCISGYQVGWYEEGISTRKKHYEGYGWGYCDDKYFNIPSPIINKDYIKKFPEYKYSAIELYLGNDILKYLRLYEKYPHMEYLTKAGFGDLATSKLILKQCEKDKRFRKWLFNSKQDIEYSTYITSIIKAYKLNKPIKEVDIVEKHKKELSNYKTILKNIPEKEINKCLSYLAKNNIKLNIYEDYIKACLYLKLDMTQDKNKYPTDFHSWHDIRINQYASEKAKDDERQRKQVYEQFKKIALKYEFMQRNLKEDYCVIIAKSPYELIKEGNALHHCVGKMGYDTKFINEESLIFFIRNKNNPQIPFVTVEYSIKNKKILQCYANHNSKPEENVQLFINKIWLPYANRKIKKLAI